MQNNKAQLSIKFCIVGQQSVGKTSIIHQYIHHIFDDTLTPTIGCDFSTKIKITQQGQTIKLHIWDIVGQQKFKAISKMYLRGALGCVVVCSCNDPASVQQALKWKKFIDEAATRELNGMIPCILVQNKSDLINLANPRLYQNPRYLSQLGKKYGFCDFIQCSAKQDKNISKIFQFLLGKISINKEKAIQYNSNIRQNLKQINNKKILLSRKDTNQTQIINKRKRKQCCL